MKSEMLLAFNEIMDEHGLSREVVLEALKTALIAAYRKAVNAPNAQHVEASVDLEAGRIRIFAEKEVVEEVRDTRTEVSLPEARQVNPEANIGDMVVVDATPADFGRVAAQTARQVIQQRLREAEREEQAAYFRRQLNEIVSGVVQAINPREITLGLDLRAEGRLPRKEQIPGERLRVHERVRALLLEVNPTSRGPQIILSRAHRDFLRRLLENEVPEIYNGDVEVRSIAREAGRRSKVAVAALKPGIDAVGACVGIKGVRIQTIVRELNGEKIDVIEWSPDAATFIARALSPARVLGVYLDPAAEVKTATVVVSEDQLSLAIGREGVNARLAAKLTGWRIDIKSLPEAAADALHRLQTDPELLPLATELADRVPAVEGILGKKAEGRPVTPEEYRVLMEFVDRVERFGEAQAEAERAAAQQRVLDARAGIPDEAFDVLLDDIGLSPRLVIMLTNAGYSTAGDLMLQMRLDPDKILALDGVGPKAMEQIEAALAALEAEWQAQAAAEAAAEEEAAVEEAATPTQPEAVAEAEAEAVPASAEEAEAAPAEAEAAPAEVVAAVAAPGEAPEAEAAETAEPSLEELFRLETALADDVPLEDEEEEELPEKKGKKKKKKKKKKYVEVEYDPDEDMMIVRRKRKRGGEDFWEEDW